MAPAEGMRIPWPKVQLAALLSYKEGGETPYPSARGFAIMRQRGRRGGDRFSEGKRAMRRVTVLFSVVALVLVLLGGVGRVAPAVAQGATSDATPDATPGPGPVAADATPDAAANEFPLVADPALCQVEPRSTDELVEIWFHEGATPDAAEATPDAAVATPADQQPMTEVTIPIGPPASDAIAAGVTLTVHEVFSCFAAGDFPRATALFTDDLVRQFGPGPDETEEDVTAFLEATPVPEPQDVQIEILAVTDVMLLEDQRVGAFVVDSGPEGTHTAYAVFEHEGDRWLVDEVIEFGTGGEEEGEE